MPLDNYFKGHGIEVMNNMTKEYGAKKAKNVFYGTANSKGMKPKGGPSPAGMSELGRPRLKRKLP